MAEDIGAQAVEQALEHHDHHEADHEHIQGGHAAVHQHLVHHDLEEQGTDQRKELEHERNQQHLTQELAVLDEAGDKPGEVELGEVARQAGAAGDEDELTRPLGGEGLHGFDDWAGGCTCGSGVLQQHPLAVTLGEDHGAHVAIRAPQLGQCGQWAQGKPVGRGAREFGLEAQVLCGPEQVLRAGGLARLQTQLVRQGGWVGGYLVEAGQDAQRSGLGALALHPTERLLRALI